MTSPGDLTAVLDLSPDELERHMQEAGAGRYRARQVLTWIYHRHVTEFERMTDLPAPLRQKLAASCTVLTSSTRDVRRSRDGTAKILLGFPDGASVETVHIPEAGSGTVCLSTQVGCAVRCVFCASGARGFTRDLSTGEILEQMLGATSLPRRRTDHVVFMGMGEPMANLDSVLKAIRVLKSKRGFGLSARRITVSTVGVIAGMRRLAAEEPGVNLAISLHAPDDATRRKLVPGMKNVPVRRLVAAARDHSSTTGRRVSFEYVLVDGINDSAEQARDLVKRLRSFPVFVNLIPLNPVPGTRLAPPPLRRVRQFEAELRTGHIPAAVRKRRGTDIEAACGQLALKGMEPHRGRSARSD